MAGAGKDDATGLHWLEDTTHYFRHLFSLTGRQVARPDGNGQAYVYTNLVLDGAAFNSYFGLLHCADNECATCGLTEHDYARPLTEARPSRPGRPMMMGLPVMDFQDWQPVFTPEPPVVRGVLLHHPIFRVVWAPRHALAHEISDHIEFTIDLLEASDVPKGVIEDYTRHVRRYAGRKWNAGRQISWKLCKKLLDEGGLPRIPPEFDQLRFLDDPASPAPHVQRECINSLAAKIEQQVAWFRCCGDHRAEAASVYKDCCDQVHMRWVALYPAAQGHARMRISTHQALHEFPRVWASLGPDAPDICSEEAGEAAHHLAKDLWFKHSTRTTTNKRRRGWLSGWIDLLRGVVQSWTLWRTGDLHVHWAGHLRNG